VYLDRPAARPAPPGASRLVFVTFSCLSFATGWYWNSRIGRKTSTCWHGTALLAGCLPPDRRAFPLDHPWPKIYNRRRSLRITVISRRRFFVRFSVNSLAGSNPQICSALAGWSWSGWAEFSAFSQRFHSAMMPCWIGRFLRN
jgi:hypothetical protein